MTIPTNNDSITLYETLMPKLLKPTCRKLYVYLHVKNQLHISLLFWDITKTLQSCYFENFGNDWPSPSKIILSICRKLSCLSACKKSTSSFTAFLRYCKEIANFLCDCNWTRIQNHLVHKRTLNHLAKLAKLAWMVECSFMN